MLRYLGGSSGSEGAACQRTKATQLHALFIGGEKNGVAARLEEKIHIFCESFLHFRFDLI